MNSRAPVGDRRSVRVPKTAELVAGHIRKQIVTRQLHDGDALPTETALVEQYGISRPTLREAFRILESEGLITVRRGARGGARVQEPSSEVTARYAGLVLQHRNTTVADVLAARVIVEAPAARLLAERRSRGKIVKQLRADLDAYSGELDHFHDFHELVVELTENQTLILMSAILEGICQEAALRYSADAEIGDRMLRRAVVTRAKLIDLIDAGEGAAAEELWRRYLTEAAEVLASGTGRSVVDLFA